VKNPVSFSFTLLFIFV